MQRRCELFASICFSSLNAIPSLQNLKMKERGVMVHCTLLQYMCDAYNKEVLTPQAILYFLLEYACNLSTRICKKIFKISS
jgi:hypothetical protein